ncbi:MAG TPA: redoxin domain-containing protein [Nitrospirae bacterium]|nr:thiol-disulfide oxidoreductase ResA [bacterium BMS3Abin10]GBE38236.1 thiol-disulfide oxidoreductase ResA [bacterium BMS3Bbin08]HDO25660.1 redoxin domain-containing protein [Nitrospirota bacterium]HDZ84079.1 redoxin domain-containing protein [Nitrospirota bacterium]
MKITIILFSLFVLLNPYAHADAVSIPMGGSAPDFSLESIEGKTVSIDDFRGKVTVLIYWRPDQKRSVLALKDGMELYRSYREKGVEVVTLVADTEKKEDVLKSVKKAGVEFPVLMDTDRKVYGDYGIRVYPSTVIIDKEGKLSYDIPGHAVTYRSAVEGYVRRLLGEINDEELNGILNPHKEKKDKSALEAERRYNLALKFTESGLNDQAIDALNKSIEAKSDIAKSYILLGFLLLEDKEADAALDAFNKAIKLEPGSHDAKTGIGGALILKGDLDGAIEILNDAAKANPYPQKTYYELGMAYELKGEKDSAIKMYKKALDKIVKKKILPSSMSK